eukprot:3042313-Ditylum_brightwellii.AAC.1
MWTMKEDIKNMRKQIIAEGMEQMHTQGDEQEKLFQTIKIAVGKKRERVNKEIQDQYNANTTMNTTRITPTKKR